MNLRAIREAKVEPKSGMLRLVMRQKEAGFAAFLERTHKTNLVS